MTLGALLAVTLGCAYGAMVAVWILSLPLRNASIVDIWWGFGFVGIAAVSFALSDPGHPLLLGLTALWGLRLGGYLLWRNAGEGEDPRYVAMRRHWGARFPIISLATVFTFQGVLQWTVSLPVQVAQHAGAPEQLGPLAWLGLALFAVGLFFETVGDAQLARFKADPDSAGKVLDTGLWRYTRHPNYFGDCCAWWGLFAVSLDASGAIWTVVGPLVMTVLLMRVSGVALLERSIGKRRPEYGDYQRRTSSFIPLPPRSLS